MLADVLMDGLSLGVLYAVIALGYTMVYGVLELINFAHGEVFMVGAYVGTVSLLGVLSMSWVESLPRLVVLMIILVFSGLMTGVLGLGIERFAYAPLRKSNSPKLIALITALAVSLLLQDSVRLLAEQFGGGNYNVTGRTLLTEKFTVPLSQWFSGMQDFDIKANVILCIVIAVAIMIGLDVFVNRTKWGVAMRAVAQDPNTAQLMAVNVQKVVMLTFFIGSALAGATGFLFSQQYTTVDPYMGYQIGIRAFTAAVLGGIGNLRGAMLGGILIGMSEVLLGSYFGAAYKNVYTFLILITVLIFKPGGLLGKVVREKV